MDQPSNVSPLRDDTLWAVVASFGRTTRVAEIFSNRLAHELEPPLYRDLVLRAYREAALTGTPSLRRIAS